MPDTRICERRVIFVSDKKSQTVNVCTLSGRSGVYDWIVRFDKDVPVRTEIEAVRPATIPDLVQWLKEDMDGKIHRIPPAHDPLLGHDWRPGAEPETPLGQSIMEAAEREINCLVAEFLKDPYMHRSEYNLHCELYDYLRRHIEPRSHKLGCGDNQVRLVHKEWPERHWSERMGSLDAHAIWPPIEAGIAPHRSKKRGLFDVAVLSPASIETCPNTASYLEGRFGPVAAFEFGLIENYDHLRSDIAKLINNRLRYGCVIHFVRPGETDNFEAIEDLINQAGDNSFIRTAYARVGDCGDGVPYHYKFVNAPAVVHSAERPVVEQ